MASQVAPEVGISVEVSNVATTWFDLTAFAGRRIRIYSEVDDLHVARAQLVDGGLPISNLALGDQALPPKPFVPTFVRQNNPEDGIFDVTLPFVAFGVQAKVAAQTRIRIVPMSEKSTSVPVA